MTADIRGKTKCLLWKPPQKPPRGKHVGSLFIVTTALSPVS